MTTKALTTNLYHFYTTQLNPMSDAQIAKQHSLSLDELEDWKEKNSIQQQGVNVEEEKHSRTVSILDKDKPALTLELYKSYKELPKPISDNAIGNEHGMSVGDMQKFKREHDLIGKYGKNTKDAVEKRVEPVEKVTAAKEVAEEKGEALKKVEEIEVLEYKTVTKEDVGMVDAKVLIKPEDYSSLSELIAPKIEQIAKIDATHLVISKEQAEEISKQLAEVPTELGMLAENPDFTTFRNEYVPSDTQAAEMIRLRQELEALRREQEWLENRHVQDTEIVESVNAVIKKQEADQKQLVLMEKVMSDLKDTHYETVNLHGYAPVPHNERMSRLISTLGMIAGHEEQNDYTQYLNLIALASEVLAHAEQVRADKEGIAL